MRGARLLQVVADRAPLHGPAPSLIAPQLPFDKNCGSDGVCEDNLQIAFNFSG